MDGRECFHILFFFVSLLFSRKKVLWCGAVLMGSLTAQTVFICLYWPVSRCAVGREGVSPDLPLPGWESTGRHSWAGVGEELAEGWKISVKVVMGGTIFKQKTGSEGRGCCMGKESRPAGHQSRCRGCAESWGAGASSGLGKHADKAGCLVAPPTPYFDAQDHQTTSPVA